MYTEGWRRVGSVKETDMVNELMELAERALSEDVRRAILKAALLVIENDIELWPDDVEAFASGWNEFGRMVASRELKRRVREARRSFVEASELLARMEGEEAQGYPSEPPF